MTLGQRIQELRKQAGLSQEGLGEALGVSRQAVSKWEGDNGIPELDTLIAMSKLFGVTLGQLLGVEEPAPAEEESAAVLDEEKIEAVLRRYVEESRQHESHAHATVWPRIVAICCIAVVAIVALVTTSQIRQVRQSVDTLWNNITDIEGIVTNVRNQVGGLSDELRGVLEEQSSLLSTFDYEVVTFDVEKQTVDLRLSTTLKSYTEGSKVQFLLDWKMVDQTGGELVCDPVEGPKFETTATIPMNYHLDIGVRVLQPDGTILEQPMETIYSGMHPGEFAVQFRSAGSMIGHLAGSYSYDLEMYSEWPNLIYPVSAVTVITREGEEVYRQEEVLVVEDGTYKLAGAAQLDPQNLEEDTVEVWCYVTDNYGREQAYQLPWGPRA